MWSERATNLTVTSRSIQHVSINTIMKCPILIYALQKWESKKSFPEKKEVKTSGSSFLDRWVFVLDHRVFILDQWVFGLRFQHILEKKYFAEK